MSISNDLLGDITISCDECGEELDTNTDNFGQAIEHMKDNGWINKKDDKNKWQHVCEECKS